MKKRPLVFSLVREQSIFMTVVISVLAFLSVLSFGIALAIGTGVNQWNSQWNKFATVQVINPENTASVKKIFESNRDKIESVTEISKQEMEKILQPWVSSGAKLNEYLPQTFEIAVKDAKNIQKLKEEISPKAKFLTHNSALQTTMSAGWKLVTITSLVLALILISIGVCVSYISKNIAMLHKHELEILNQVGATDKFIAHQMQMIIAKISSIACLVGFILATPILFMILSAARSARVGLMATLYLSGGDIVALMVLPLIIVIFSIYITKKTTLKILAR